MRVFFTIACITIASLFVAAQENAVNTVTVIRAGTLIDGKSDPAAPRSGDRHPRQPHRERR